MNSLRTLFKNVVPNIDEHFSVPSFDLWPTYIVITPLTQRLICRVVHKAQKK